MSTHRQGQAWAVRQFSKKRCIREYLQSCFDAKIATDFHRGALQTINLLEGKK